MKIKLISYADATIEAWLNSRPALKANEVNLSELRKLDLPVNEFFNLNIEIECSILVREIFTSFSSHVIWAQTSRVQNILEFEIDETLDKSEFEPIREKMIELSKNERQDDYRLNLPLLSLTKFTTSISFRNLIKFAKYFEYLYEKFNYDFLLNATNEIYSLINNFGWETEIANGYKKFNLLCENYKSSNSTSSSNGNFITVETEIPMYLRAQLVRHRGIIVVDNLFDLLKNKEILKSDLKTMVKCQVTGTIDVLQEIVSKRACWIAQYNIWSDFLNKLIRILPEVKLPCSSGKCPFSEDAFLRYREKDPNPPCPIHCIQNNLKVKLQTRERMYDLIKKDSRDSLFWGDFVRATKLE